jgi:hypothetical protein
VAFGPWPRVQETPIDLIADISFRPPNQILNHSSPIPDQGLTNLVTLLGVLGPKSALRTLRMA